MPQDVTNSTNNHLLSSLPRTCAERLLKSATKVDLLLGEVLYQREELPRFLYLLTSGIVSVVFNSERGTTVELATQGNEGLIGWVHLLGPELTQADCTVQVSGAGYRIPLSAIQREFDTVTEIRLRILEHGQH